jgi:hypothetical protein
LTIAVYVVAFAWAWYETHQSAARLPALVRGLLLVGTVLLVVWHDLSRSGAEARRRVRNACRRVRQLQHWPTDLLAIPNMPSVRALTAAVPDEPGPVLEMLSDPRAELRAVALSALVAYRHWRPAELAFLQTHIRQANDPAVRALAIRAVARVNDATTAKEIASHLRDASPIVRTAATQAVLTDSTHRWSFVRDEVRAYLADPRFDSDGGFFGTEALSAVVACDLGNWALEPDQLGRRAIRCLIKHYTAILQQGPMPELVGDLIQQTNDSTSPTELRVELATLLRSFGLLNSGMLDSLTNANQPTPLRLLAAETLLMMNPHDGDGLDVLRGLGRQGNREMAIAIARLLQNHLHLDMGLPTDPRSMSGKQVAEVVKRVQAWAGMRSSSTPAGAMPGLPPETPPPGLKVTTMPPAGAIPPSNRLKPGRSPW